MQNILLPLLLNIALLAWRCLDLFHLSPPPAVSTEVAPNLAANNELRVLRAINEEIVSLLPLGLLVHDRKQTARLSAIKLPTTCCRI